MRLVLQTNIFFFLFPFFEITYHLITNKTVVIHQSTFYSSLLSNQKSAIIPFKRDQIYPPKDLTIPNE